MQAMNTCTHPYREFRSQDQDPFGFMSHQGGPDLTMIGVRALSEPHLYASDSGVRASFPGLTRILEP